MGCGGQRLSRGEGHEGCQGGSGSGQGGGWPGMGAVVSLLPRQYLYPQTSSCCEPVPDSFLSSPLLRIPPFFRLLPPGFRPLRGPLFPPMWLSSPSPYMSGTDATRSFKKSNCGSSSMHCFQWDVVTVLAFQDWVTGRPSSTVTPGKARAPDRG